MIPLYRPEQVRAFDQHAFERGVRSLDLMERAAGHLARAVVDLGGHGYGLRVGVLCGKGNNGGDGIAAARRLLDAGAHPIVCLVAGDDDLSDDAADQLRRWKALGGRIAGSVEEVLQDCDVAVDCLLGTGAAGRLRPPYDRAVELLNQRGAKVLACDIPTGVDADTGQVAGAAVHAGMTVTLGAHKRGLWLSPARSYAGRLVLGDLGIVEASEEPAAQALEPADIAGLVPPPPLEIDKRDRGVVVILAGSPGMSGAATLVARSAVSVGAGLVTVATSALARQLVAAAVPEALTVELPDDDPDAAFETLASQLEGADVLAAGPGLGHAEPTAALVRRLVRSVDVPVVLDADGLNVFRHDGDALRSRAAPLLVLTPHAREFARLTGPDSPADLWPRRVETAPERAKQWDAVIVAKGPGSLTAAPDGRCWINPTGGPALATGGTGDVLTGMAATLVAQRPEPESVATAVWIHGLAGDIAAQRAGARSVSSMDVASSIPAAFRRLANHRS